MVWYLRGLRSCFVVLSEGQKFVKWHVQKPVCAIFAGSNPLLSHSTSLLLADSYLRRRVPAGTKEVARLDGALLDTSDTGFAFHDTTPPLMSIRGGTAVRVVFPDKSEISRLDDVVILSSREVLELSDVEAQVSYELARMLGNGEVETSWDEPLDRGR
ncbi:hypothetical protein BDR04DRAFT_199335 [Suillus decipiens]|nr:hypothetical protein BDR04DRAFT_199335 [Suillus decipiens]